MVKHNNIIPNVHLRKHWSRQKNHTHHDQPAAKLRRYRRRQDKAAKLFPRPLQKLRPVVASQTRRYAGKVWLLELGGLLQLDQLVCALCIVGGQRVVSVRSSGERGDEPEARSCDAAACRWCSGAARGQLCYLAGAAASVAVWRSAMLRRRTNAIARHR